MISPDLANHVRANHSVSGSIDNQFHQGLFRSPRDRVLHCPEFTDKNINIAMSPRAISSSSPTDPIGGWVKTADGMFSCVT